MSGVSYTSEEGVARIVLDRPERRNALSEDVVTALLHFFRQAADDPAVRVIVLAATGDTFCAGADLKAGGVRPHAGEQPFVTLLKTMWHCPKPILGCISGSAFGGGLGLVAACDLTIAAEEAQFAFSEVRLGVVPAMISVVVLPKIGVHHATWLFLTGERFSAPHAREIGLIHKVVPRRQLESAMADTLATLRLAGPSALQHAKTLLRQVPQLSMDEAFRYTANLVAELFASPEAQEGMRAFAEKRKPSWAS